MNLKVIFTLILMLPVFTACIQDEPLNPEADILEFNLPAGIALSEPIFNQNSITVMVRKTADLTSLKPQIVITEGATISPDTTVARDFTNAVSYKVTSHDGKNERNYTVQLISSSIYKYNFEHWEEKPRLFYETPTEVGVDGSIQYPWASSNIGVAIYQQYPTAGQYPVHSTTKSFSGKYAAEMNTQAGPGNIMNIQFIPIVAGSLFTGTLIPLNALKDPLSATQFGLPFTEKPLRFKGHYKYKAGMGDYIGSDGKPVPGKKDICALYAVFYKVDAATKVLDGNNILTHPNIRAVAMLPDRSSTEGDGFHAFDLEFDYSYSKGEAVDFDKYDYKLAIVFSSSMKGDHYEGTPGSTLVVDNVELEIEDNE